MRSRKPLIFVVAYFLIATFLVTGYVVAKDQDIMAAGPPADMEAIEKLGWFLYFDENLSKPIGQSCASCHEPSVGFDEPDENLPVSEGAIEGRFGNRNAPISAYAMYAPSFHYDVSEGLYVGGQFWDGRATGEVLGDPLADQAIGPPLNPVEMANPNKKTFVKAIKNSEYADLFEAVWGEGALKNIEAAYDQAGLAVAAFERTEMFAAFDAAYDQYLQACLGEGYDKDSCAIGAAGTYEDWDAFFTEKAWDGFQLFMNDVNDNDGILEADEGAMCVACHVVDWIDPSVYGGLNVVVPEWSPDGTIPPLFTDFTYDNLGVPRNPDNPWYDLPPNLNPDGADWTDYGLGGVLTDPMYNVTGLFKVMPLRNIGVSAPYSHNGFFTTLVDITEFYNSRDDPEMDWPMAEIPETVNFDELGNLGLNGYQVEALADFMRMLTDGDLAE